MGKHAYLIIAHNKFEQLKMLCEMLDFEQNDIYMHIDAHVTDFDADSFRPSLRHSKMKFAERTRVNWGGYSQIQAELNLLKAAANSGEDYSYYHLLSGADLPLRPAQEIWGFFEQRGTEFIHFSAHDLPWRRGRRSGQSAIICCRKRWADRPDGCIIWSAVLWRCRSCFGLTG